MPTNRTRVSDSSKKYDRLGDREWRYQIDEPRAEHLDAFVEPEERQYRIEDLVAIGNILAHVWETA